MWRFGGISLPFYTNKGLPSVGTQTDSIEVETPETIDVCCAETDPQKRSIGSGGEEKHGGVRWNWKEDAVLYKNLLDFELKYKVDVWNLVFDSSAKAVRFKVKMKFYRLMQRNVDKRSRMSIRHRVRRLLRFSHQGNGGNNWACNQVNM